MTWPVPEREISLRFTPSGGPGGQHANRSSTRVEATFDIAGSAEMPEALRRRVIDKLGPVVRVVVDDERSQSRNRAIALERLQARIDAAGFVERPRRPTKATRSSKRRRLEAKRRLGDLTRGRQRPSEGH